ESRIQIGEQLGFRVTTTTQTSTLESVEFLDVGVVLTVTPRITRDGRVLMRIQPEVSSGAVNPETGLPEEETTELQTDALLTTGQGMIIGGLIQERDSTVISKVPLLGSVPYAGFFFQRRQLVKSRSEIIVALVPHVMPYSPIQQQRNDDGFRRAFTPLTYGPLCRFPRPEEPRLIDTMQEHPPWMCSHDDPCCGVPTTPAWATIRRLPPVEEAIETPIDCGPELLQPEIATRPGGLRIR
ncbi:MAG: type II and III secretion system protein, partial [Planctomycetota bacterium]